MKKYFVLLLTTTLFSLLTLFLAFRNTEKPYIPFEPNFILAKTDGELKTLRKDFRNNIIRTLDDFDKMIADKISPLSALSKQEINSFKSEIVIREGLGVVGLKYGDIKQRLRYDNFAEVMAMFGIDAKYGFWGLSEDRSIQRKLRGNTLLEEDEKKKKCIKDECKSGYDDYICMEGCES